MKKITLILLMLSSTIGFAQGPWNFPTDVQSWVVQGSSTVSWDGTVFNTASGSLKTVTTAITAGAKSPTFTPTISGDYIFSAYIKGTAGDKVRLDIFQGSSSIGTDYTLLTSNFELVTRTVTVVEGTNMTLRILDRTGSKTIYIDDVTFTYQIPAGNTTLTTNVVGSGSVTKNPNQGSYLPTDVVSLTANPTSHWSFSNWSGDLSGTTSPANITMSTNKTVTANFIVDPSFKYDFLFNTDSNLEGWTLDPQFIVSSHTGSLVTLTPTANQFARLSLLGFPIPTDPMATKKYNKVTVVLKNNSATTNELAVVVGTVVSGLTPITTSDTGYQTYIINLTENTAWTGDVTSFKLRFADTANTGSPGKPSDAGTIIIDDITFSYDSSLGLPSNVDAKNKISLYPMPTREVLNISSSVQISSAEFYDVTGKMVLKENQFLNNQINVSNLKSGIYIVRLKDVDNKIEDKKVIISK
jgi:hypothetical protein